MAKSKMAADLLKEDLPPGWSYGVTRDGRVFFISERHQETTWLHPVTGQPVQTGHHKPYGLPCGWEQDFTPEGDAYFIDHNNQQTSFIHPVTGSAVSEENPHQSPSLPGPNVGSKANTRKGNNSVKQRTIKAPAAKRNASAQVVRQGLLYRLESGGISKAWKKRWCVLAEFALFIYKNNEEKNELSSILLPSYKVSPCTVEDSVVKEFTFKIEHENTKTEYFHTDSQVDLDRWLFDLQLAATMKGSVGVSQEANNIRSDASVIRPNMDQPRGYPDDRSRFYQHNESSFHPQRRNIHHNELADTETGPPLNSLSGQPPWQSVPDLERGGQGLQERQVVDYNCQGSLLSLPPVLSKNHGFPSPNLRKAPRNYHPQWSHTSHPEFDRPDDGRPGGTVHDDRHRSSLNRTYPEPPHASVREQNIQRRYLPTPRETNSLPRHVGSGWGHQLDPGGGGHSMRSRPHRDEDNLPRNIPSKQRNGFPSQSGTRNDGFTPGYNRQASDDSAYGKNRNNWKGSNSSSTGHSRSFSPSDGGNSDPYRGYSERYKYPKPYQEPNFGGDKHKPGQSFLQNTSYDLQGSFTGSGHSGSNHSHRDHRNNGRTSEGKVDSSLDSNNSLPRSHPQAGHSPQHSAPYDSYGHTYVNIPEMQNAVLRYSESQKPQRSVHPASRDDMLQQLPNTQNATHHKDTADSFTSRSNTLPKQFSKNSIHSNPNNSSAFKRHSVSDSQRGSSNSYSDSWHGQDYGAVCNGDPSSHFPTDRRSAENSRQDQAQRDSQVAEPQVESSFGGDPEARSMRQAFERVQSFRQSAAARAHHNTSDHFTMHDMKHPDDGSRFEHSSDSQISTESALNPVFTGSPALQYQDGRVKPKFLPHDRLSNADSTLMKEELEMSHNTTLSPSGSYHHIDRDLDELYRRGSAFRPPSSTSGSMGGEGFFHSLPRSYKFKSIPDAVRETGLTKQTPGISQSGNFETNSSKDWEWYKEKYLSPKAARNNQNTGQKSRNHPRSISDLGFIQEKKNYLQVCQETKEEAEEMCPPPKPLRSALFQTQNSHFGQGLPDKNYGSQDSLSRNEPNLQSWPTQVLTARQLDVPTPSSLSSHPFFVPEDPHLSPPREGMEDLTPRTKMDKQLREDLDEGVYAKLKARDGMNRHPIQTVREDPNMPDSEVVETKAQKKHPLNGTRLRMSISAGDLIGKTHDELVLLLIQLRRNQSALNKARDFYRESISKRRSSEKEYHKQRQNSVGYVEEHLEAGHNNFVNIRSQLEEVERKLEVYRPLINLVDNMVTMGSLYGGDNLMLATQYRKHLLRPDQYQPPRKMLEFSRQHQERCVVTGKQNYVKHLTAAEVDLEEKIERLNQLDRLLQEQSFKVSSFREDKELLEKALIGILRLLRESQESPQEMNKLQSQLVSVEKELSRVTQDLAEASKALEETTAENSRTEHEVSLLRSKVQGQLKRSKSAPSLATENANTKVKMEKELAQVQNMLQGLSQTGEKLSQQMKTIRRSSSGTQLVAALDEAERSRRIGTYMETDLDSGNQMDLAQQLTEQCPETYHASMIHISQVAASHQESENPHGFGGSVDDGELRTDWDGLLLHEKSRGLTVRDVKRQSAQRREWKRDDDDQHVPPQIQSMNKDKKSLIHSRYPSYASSQSSMFDLSAPDPHSPSAPVYENLPHSGHLSATYPRGPQNRQYDTSRMLSQESILAGQAQTADMYPQNLGYLPTPESHSQYSRTSQLDQQSMLNGGSQRGQFTTPSSQFLSRRGGSRLHSSDDDPISNAKIDDVPDVVKSSLNNVDSIDHIDENTIDREILFFPEKVSIPERYDAEADGEHLTEGQKLERQEKAERIKRLLTNQSSLSMSQPDINHISSEQLHSRVLQEKQERAHILTLNQELARQVTQQSKKAAAERRKTWSGGQIADVRTLYESELRDGSRPV